MTLLDLPAVNASLNAVSTALLLLGYSNIKNGKRQAHRNAMVAAFVTSTLFLVSYLTYHTYVGYVLKRGPTVFADPQWFRPIYLLILLTHTMLAAAVVPMVLLALWRAWRGRYESHRKIARWAWPVWLYVSITGVLIYLLLYVVFPQRA